MAENYLITGYHGTPHVTAENDRGVHAAIFGPGRFVLPVGEMFRAEYIGNNTVRMYDGKLMDNGAAAGIPAGRYIDLLIPEAGQGMKRNDLIVFQYKKDASTLVESGSFVVVKGEETAESPADPDLTHEDLLSDSANLDQMALWRVPVSATVISAPVQLFEVSKNIRSICNMVVVASSGNGVAYTADVEGIDKLFNGLTITIIPDVASASTSPTLNVNGLGAKTIRRRVSGNMALTVAGSSDDWLAKNKPIIVTYNGTYWLTDNIRPNANDLYGNTPITGGGTGADTLKGAQANLQIAPAIESDVFSGCYYRGVVDDMYYQWINPPMKDSSVYLTDKRFNNNYVYTACCNLYDTPLGPSASANFAALPSGAKIINIFGAIVTPEGTVHGVNSEYLSVTRKSNTLVTITNKSEVTINGMVAIEFIE